MKLFACNLPELATEEDVRACFERFGRVDHVELVKGGTPYWGARVVMPKRREAMEAVTQMHGIPWKGRVMIMGVERGNRVRLEPMGDEVREALAAE